MAKVKIKAEVIKDAISKGGRVIGIRVSTDDEFINQLLEAPFTFNKTFPINISAQAIIQVFKSEMSSTINSLKQRIKDETLQGKKLEFDV